MAYYVYDGARLRCSFGDMEPKLIVIDPEGKGYMHGKCAANIKDRKEIVNIPPFGMCKSLQNPAVAAATAANLGTLTPQPCVYPLNREDWKNGTNSGYYVRGEPVLMKDAKLMCDFGGGIIEIAEEIFEGIKTGALGIEEDMIDDTDVNFGPGTRYINTLGWLLYQRMDGQTGNVRICKDESSKFRFQKAKANGTLNDPNNKDLLSIGITGEQYTNERNWGYTERLYYEAGYSGDIIAITTMRSQLVALGAMASDDASAYALAQSCNEAIEEGISDREKGIIDRLNPTSRIGSTPVWSI